jgi:hypothetical protein
MARSQSRQKRGLSQDRRRSPSDPSRSRSPETPSDSTRAWVAGTILDRDFVGQFVRCTITVNDRTIIADQPHYIGRPAHASASPMYVGVDPGQIRVLPPADPHIEP